jgi:hypothetical protein
MLLAPLGCAPIPEGGRRRGLSAHRPARTDAGSTMISLGPPRSDDPCIRVTVLSCGAASCIGRSGPAVLHGRTETAI